MLPSESKPPLSYDFPTGEEERDRISTVPSSDLGHPTHEHHRTFRGTSFVCLIVHQLAGTHLYVSVFDR
ncbi:hypothetical protein COCNU_contig69021249G000010 [Cocos nucifera]|nr:hypothetical protein [Cocos nucifera]